MFNLIRTLPTSTLLRVELPAIAMADIIAESFYKFGSFTLEALSFLATWYVISMIFNRFGNPQHRPGR